MNNVYEDSKDLHIRAVCVYAKTADAYAYSDAAYTAKIDAATLKDLFQKGAIVFDNGVEYAPTSFKMDSAVGVLTYVKADNATPTVAVLALLKSSEFAG